MARNYLLNNLENRVKDNWEADNFEIDQASMVEDYLKANYGMQTATARTKSLEIVRDPVQYKQIRQEMSANGTMGKFVQGSKNASSAFFNLRISRLTANIAGIDLPVPLFGFNSTADLYQQVMAKYLPAGVTIVYIQLGSRFLSDGAIPAGTLADANKLLITYDQGGLQDTIEVTCNEVPYPYFLQSMGTDFFSLSKMRMKLSDKTLTAQFDNKMLFDTKTMFGRNGDDSITPSQFFDPKQYQDGVLDIDGVFQFDKDTVLVTSIIPTAGFQVNMAAFVELFFRQG